MRIFVLALRNLGRNKRRTLLTGLAVGFGVLAIVALRGFGNGFLTAQVETSVLAKVGAVQVFKKGYLGADDPLKMSLPDDPALLARIAAVPGVTAVAPRIDFEGMISNGADSTVFAATGIDPVREYRVCPKRATSIAPGSQPLGPGNDSDALIGQTLSEALGAKKGGTLVMQSAGAHKGSNAMDVTIIGFLPAYNLIESKRGATVSLRFAQTLLRMKGRVTEYVVSTPDLDRADEVAGRLRAVLGDEYQVTTWRDLDWITRDRIKGLAVFLGIIALVLFLLVATGIVNTMLMSVYERVREIGTMLAVGMKRLQVTVLFLWEAIALGLFSAIAGSAGGYALVWWMGHRGLTIRQPGGDQMVLRPAVGFHYLLWVIAFAVVGTALAALYPAWKGSHLRPVDALRAT
jgi:putative ABC transport system permease protein